MFEQTHVLLHPHSNTLEAPHGKIVIITGKVPIIPSVMVCPQGRGDSLSNLD